MEDFSLNLEFDVPAHKVYHAIATKEGLRSWWTTDCKISSQIGGLSQFHFPGDGFYVFVKNLDLVPDEKVEWSVIESMHPKASGWKNLKDWEGTRILFEIEKLGETRSRLKFRHIGLNASLESFQTCSNGWNYYLGDSLRSYLNKGMGKPYQSTPEHLGESA